MPEPATRSFTVFDTSTSPGSARADTRAPMWTAIPRGSLFGQLDLARVQAGADVDSQLADGAGDRAGALDRSRGTVERREEAVPCRVDLAAAKASQL